MQWEACISTAQDANPSSNCSKKFRHPDRPDPTPPQTFLQGSVLDGRLTGLETGRIAPIGGQRFSACEYAAQGCGKYQQDVEPLAGNTQQYAAPRPIHKQDCCPLAGASRQSRPNLNMPPNGYNIVRRARDLLSGARRGPANCLTNRDVQWPSLKAVRLMSTFGEDVLPEDAAASRPINIGFIGAGGINFGTAAGCWYVPLATPVSL